MSRFSRNEAKVQGGVQEIVVLFRFQTQNQDFPDEEAKKLIFLKNAKVRGGMQKIPFFLCEV